MNSSTEETAAEEQQSDPAATDSEPQASEPRASEPTASEPRPIRRPIKGRMLAGVAAGIGEHFNVDVTIVRIVFAVLTIVGFTSIAYLGGLPLYLGGIPLYLACWLLIPEEGSEHSIASAFLRNRQSRSG
jgi:phage shock protein PspC (stress-responsive transcriptional regulator)